ncbi:hypothetical protein [Paenibacillus macerans]|nr:hypothetical protein [Paenibacillus macerans]
MGPTRFEEYSEKYKDLFLMTRSGAKCGCQAEVGTACYGIGCAG